MRSRPSEIGPPLSFSNPPNLERDLVLILTATIDVKGMPKAYPPVPEQRQEDYYNSLKYYVTHQPRIQKIVFVENSGWPLNRVREATADNPHGKRVEFISIDGNDFPRTFGKGYGETLLLEKGMALSELVTDSSYIAKITGRIYLLNMTDLLASVREPYDCLCDFKDPFWKRWGGDQNAPAYADTRFLVFNKFFYTTYLQPMHGRHHEGCFYSEHQYHRAIRSAIGTAKVIDRFPIEPKFAGIAGHFQGKDYDSRSERAKFAVRSVTRKLAPWIYL
jgi:hypothetical protein